jgi:hypothetical protein
MKGLTALTAILTAGAACGLGFGAGGLGGIALPTGEMASDYVLYYQYTPSGGSLGFDGGNMRAGAKLGGRAYLTVLPYLEVEAAFAYHFNHAQKDWDVPAFDEPEYRIIPVTAGANYVLRSGPVALYASGGAGYYLARGTLSGTFNVPPFGDVEFSGDLTANKAGFYVGGGFRYYFGRFALDAGPRFHYVLNDGTYDVDMEYDIGLFRGSVPFEVEKGFNDSFVDILVGASYYFI